MSLTQVLNPIEVRYASGELAQGHFIKLEDHEIVMAERDYWHHMYNQATAPEAWQSQCDAECEHASQVTKC